MNDVILDFSEFYDFELFEIDFKGIDFVLDSSEYYDYDLGDICIDYIYNEFGVGTYYILTEDVFVINTEDGYRLRLE